MCWPRVVTTSVGGGRDNYAPEWLGLVVHVSDRRGNEAAVFQLLPLLKRNTARGR